jgi:hypothetical protein
MNAYEDPKFSELKMMEVNHKVKVIDEELSKITSLRYDKGWKSEGVDITSVVWGIIHSIIGEPVKGRDLVHHGYIYHLLIRKYIG